MNPKDAIPRFALVVWPESESPACIYLDAVEDAVRRGAVVIAREPEGAAYAPVIRPNFDDTQLGDD